MCNRPLDESLKKVPSYWRVCCLSYDGTVVARVAVEWDLASESVKPCPIPSPASNSKYEFDKELQTYRPLSASKSASKISTREQPDESSILLRHDLLKRNWSQTVTNARFASLHGLPVGPSLPLDHSRSATQTRALVTSGID